MGALSLSNWIGFPEVRGGPTALSRHFGVWVGLPTSDYVSYGTQEALFLIYSGWGFEVL